MPTSSLTVLGALGPIFVMIVLGQVLRRYDFPSAAFWPAAERLTYFLLFPALLLRELASADLRGYAIGPFVGVGAAAVILMSLLLFALRPLLQFNGAVFGSVFQGSLRFNTYVGLAAASALLHTTGTTLAALALAILIPLVNVLSVGVLIHGNGRLTGWGLLAALVRNPLILACAAGILLNRSGVGLPWGSAGVVDILARAALPLGLLVVGAALRAQAAVAQPRALLLSTTFKLLALPVLTASLSWIAGLNRQETAILVLFSALPGAPVSYILARQMGGDAELMAAIVTVETAVSALTLPVILLILA